MSCGMPANASVRSAVVASLARTQPQRRLRQQSGLQFERRVERYEQRVLRQAARPSCHRIHCGRCGRRDHDARVDAVPQQFGRGLIAIGDHFGVVIGRRQCVRKLFSERSVDVHARCKRFLQRRRTAANTRACTCFRATSRRAPSRSRTGCRDARARRARCAR